MFINPDSTVLKEEKKLASMLPPKQTTIFLYCFTWLKLERVRNLETQRMVVELHPTKIPSNKAMGC